jgi:hypothetical protein
MEELQKSGVNVLAVCKPNSKVQEYLSSRGIESKLLPSYKKISFASVREMRKCIDERGIEVVHAHFHRDVWLASLMLRNDKKRKLFVSIYMGVPEKTDPLHRWLFQRVQGIFSSSKALNERLPKLYPVPAQKIHYMPYGRKISEYRIDLSKRTQVRSQYGVKDDETVIGTMLRIDEGKGVRDFVESYQYLEEASKTSVRFLIVGEPTRRGVKPVSGSPFEQRSEAYRDQLVQYVHDRGLQDRIIFIGYQSDTIGYLSAMDIFVFPSRDEMYSLVVLDAMCLGLPVVAARSGGNLYQVAEGESGLMYNTADSADLARKLAEYLKNPAMRDQHTKAARAFVEHEHDMKAVIERLKSFYSTIV